MVNLRSVVRDLAVVCVAVAVGWWGRDAGNPVLAQRSNSSSTSRGMSTGDSSLAFQFDSGAPQQSLSVYDPASRTIFVYPRVGVGNTYINCEYSLTITVPGAPIQRQNCPIGEQVPQR
ncbi:MAG TPA: hypothetical protein VMQ60_04175 [Acidobacteriaceae bacterium]|jgi:hypothetical protein|nr:hypothetical protein [Acidobacteriaceae bacterium]